MKDLVVPSTMTAFPVEGRLYVVPEMVRAGPPGFRV